MSLPKITIVTPTFNQAEFIRETLRSIQDQEYPNLEHIVVDAMSTDSTPEILREYSLKPNVLVIREADRGQSDGINKGMKRASGEIVSWLNSDDVLESAALLAVAETFTLNSSASAVCGVGSKMDRSGNLLRTVPFRPFDPRRLMSALEYIQPATFYRRSVWEAVGGLNVNHHYAMDWDLLIRIRKIGEIVAIQEKLARIRYYDQTKTSTGGWGRAAEIASIGRDHNGPFDINNISFQIRGMTYKSSLLRRMVDNLFWKLSEIRPIMVNGWPES